VDEEPVIDRKDAAAVWVATLLTGAAGLIDQVVWQRYLTRLVGSDTLATATVIAVFLGGLAAGYALWGLASARVGNVFRTYGLLELGIGGWALLFPWSYAAVDAATRGLSFEPPWWLMLEGALAALLLVGPPALAMGATVPLLTRGLPGREEEQTRLHARVYAANTAGAVLGTLAGGFVLVEWLGLPGALRLAASLNVAAGLYFVLGAGRLAAHVAARAGMERTRVEQRAAAAAESSSALHAVAFLGGFAFMTVEATLVRVTHLSLGASAYAFALVVAALILTTGPSAGAARSDHGPS
jgi:predicted membrane-bound spermidine synthase